MAQASIHTTLARSYVTYFVCSILGLFGDTMLGFTVLIPYREALAVVCFAVGAVLIGWAQYTSRTSKAGSDIPYFMRGPYKYMRNPTHLGMVVLVVGYTIVSGSIIFCAITVIGYFVSNVFFRKYESQLKSTYDDTYKTYQSKVPKIL